MADAYVKEQGSTYTITGTNVTGVKLESGTLEFITGTISANGTTAYGVNMTNGTLTLGVEDGRGTDASDVSTTDPYLEAIGTNSGIGISMGNGTFNYFDGKIVASTSIKATGNITTYTEPEYDEVISTDSNTGNKYCILVFNK